MNKKILVTGASGFAAKYLIQELLKKQNIDIYGTYLLDGGDKVIFQISDKIKSIKLNLINAEDVFNIINEIKPDEIYHLAALSSAKQSFGNASEFLTNNINAQLNLLESIKKLNLKSRLLIVSSAEVYGVVDEKNIPINEKVPLNPDNPYAVSKIAQDFLALQYFNSYKVDVVRVRPFNHIGPGQNDQFVASAFAKKITEIEKGKRDPILTVGNLSAKRDFSDVKDMVRAYILLMERGLSGDVYNIGSGKAYEIKQILDILLSFSKSKIEVKVDEALLRPSDTPILMSDNSKMQALTGWKPEIPLEKTLQDILEYWRGIV